VAQAAEHLLTKCKPWVQTPILPTNRTKTFINFTPVFLFNHVEKFSSQPYQYYYLFDLFHVCHSLRKIIPLLLIVIKNIIIENNARFLPSLPTLKVIYVSKCAQTNYNVYNTHLNVGFLFAVMGLAVLKLFSV
jgi:hypothetical protein